MHIIYVIRKLYQLLYSQKFAKELNYQLYERSCNRTNLLDQNPPAVFNGRSAKFRNWGIIPKMEWERFHSVNGQIRGTFTFKVGGITLSMLAMFDLASYLLGVLNL